MYFFRRLIVLPAAVGFAATAAFAFSASNVVITPTEFDFGWCPDNAKISAQFTIKNTGSDLIPITSVQPTCGCTASQFTPATLGSNEESNVGLTFNTRGYAKSSFSKSTKIKTDAGGAEYSVLLKGSVLDAQAKVVPDQDGVAGFEPGSKGKKKTIQIQNKGDKDVTLQIVQAPASWATAKIKTTTVGAGASVPIEISVDSPLDEAKDTSVTIEAKSETETSRLTIAIRTGPPPPPTKRASTAVPVPAPAPTPAKSKEK